MFEVPSERSKVKGTKWKDQSRVKEPKFKGTEWKDQSERNRVKGRECKEQSERTRVKGTKWKDQSQSERTRVNGTEWKDQSERNKVKDQAEWKKQSERTRVNGTEWKEESARNKVKGLEWTEQSEGPGRVKETEWKDQSERNRVKGRECKKQSERTRVNGTPQKLMQYIKSPEKWPGRRKEGIIFQTPSFRRGKGAMLASGDEIEENWWMVIFSPIRWLVFVDFLGGKALPHCPKI